jgi:Spy/CpxP family protein refolding chaperone
MPFKHTLRLALLTATTATASLTAQAASRLATPTQTAPGPHGNMLEELNLTPEQ